MRKASFFIIIVTGMLYYALSAAQDKPNVILISVDTLRADAVNQQNMPYLTEWSKDCLIFSRTVSQAPHTSPSHMTMLTSLYPGVHRIYNYSQDGSGELKGYYLSKGITTLAEVLKEHGYATRAFTAGVNVTGCFGFNRGFLDYGENDLLDPLVENYTPSMEPVTKWIQAQKVPYFVFFHTFVCHAGYDPPAMFKPPPPATQKDLYLGEVKYVDHQIGKWLLKLKSSGELDNTIVFFTSDHGEEFKEHGRISHNQFYEEVLRVPLIIHHPRIKPQTVSTLVRLIDIMPTILDWVGAPIPQQAQGKPISVTEATDRIAYSDIYFISHGDLAGPTVSITTSTYKYIYITNCYGRLSHVELYNLVEDPEEVVNIVGKEKDIAFNFKTKVEEFIRACEQKAQELGSSTIKSHTPTASALEKLKSLGYLK